MRLLERILSEEPTTRVIIITGNNQQANALRAIQLGASDYYSKPIRVEELKVMVQRALHLHVLQQKLYHTYSRSGEGVTGTTDVNLKLAKKAIEIDFVKKALSRNKGIVSRAARELGISRVNLYDLIQKYDIRIQEFKPQLSNRSHQAQLTDGR
jgi:DNA-binding NtrC family response regulator